MVRKGKLAVFEGSSISKPERLRPPKLVRMHLTSISTCMNFLSRFRSIKVFDDHGLQSMVRKGKLAVFEGSSISETGEAPPTKIGVHVCDINLYLHDFFDIVHGQKGKIGRF